MWPAVLFPMNALAEEETGRYHAAYRLVETSRPLTNKDRCTFDNLCRIVRKSWTTERSENRISQDNSDGDQVPELTGPAASGTYASNVSWRIEFERNTERWRACRLVLMLH